VPELTKEQLYIILGVILILIIGCIYGLFHSKSIITQSSPASPTPYMGSNAKLSKQLNIADTKPKTLQKQALYVQISGAVDREGVYKVTSGDRIFDVLDLAGVKQGADMSYINLAEGLIDGQRIEIPYKSVKSKDNAEKDVASDRKQSRININSADAVELDALPGIGATTAKRIIEYREIKGRFSSIEGLKKVQGITEKKFDKLKDQISIN
jgi:competence protein ComEA